jgi:hypothetical protein
VESDYALLISIPKNSKNKNKGEFVGERIKNRNYRNVPVNYYFYFIRKI